MIEGSRPGPRVQQITSPSNPLVKVFRRALAEGTTREGWLAVEGPFLVEEALNALARDNAALGGAPRPAGPGARGAVQSVLASRSAAQKFAELLARVPRHAELAEIPDPLFDQLAQTETPQGIAALVELPRYDLAAVLSRRDTLALVACGLQDPGNLGTMMRSAEAFGATALVTLCETVSPFNPKVVRSSAGAIFWLPVFCRIEVTALFAKLREAGVRTVAADRKSSVRIGDADLRRPVAFLIGREAAGLPAELAREATARVSIPIRAGMDSLNAATAASILLYEAARQRGFAY